MQKITSSLHLLPTYDKGFQGNMTCILSHHRQKRLLLHQYWVSKHSAGKFSPVSVLSSTADQLPPLLTGPDSFFGLYIICMRNKESSRSNDLTGNSVIKHILYLSLNIQKRKPHIDMSCKHNKPTTFIITTYNWNYWCSRWPSTHLGTSHTGNVK